MRRPDLWDKAAACARAFHDTEDLAHKIALHHLARLWATLGTTQSLMTSDEIAEETERIEEIQRKVFDAGATRH